MRPLKIAAVIAALTLSGCVDIDLTTTITGADTAEVSGSMTIQQQMLDMMGGAQAFCPPEEGAVLTVAESSARCDVSKAGTFAEVFQAEPGQPAPTATDLGDGTVRVSFPIGVMTADAAQVREDPQMLAMMRPMLEGHAAAIRVTGVEIISSNGTISEDGRTATFGFALVDMLNPDVQMPETFDTIVRY